MSKECLCGYDGDDERCINGFVYGLCSSDNCGGVCDYLGMCPHECHKETPEPATCR